MTGVQGLSFLLDLPEALMLRGGDALQLEDGRTVEVVAAPEPLLEIKGRSPRDMVRLAWHVGNRHLPAQITANAIRIRQDHVIETMLHGLGAKLVAIEAPFDPEGGAYAQGGHAHGSEDTSTHAHGHADHAGHEHAAHQQDHEHRHDRAHDHGHHHGHDHGHHDQHGPAKSHSHES